MGQKTDRKFVNGMFIKRIWQDRDDVLNSMFSMGIRKREFIDTLEAMEEDERGFVNLTVGSQKLDREKMSVWESDFKPEKKSGGSNYSKSSNTKKSSPPPPPVEDDADELPF